MSKPSDAGGDDRTRDHHITKRTIGRNIGFGRLSLFWEEALPRAVPLLALTGLFLGVSWMGVWPLLPLAAHLALLGLFAAGLLWSVWMMRGIRWPDRARARRRVEIASGLANRPLETLEDYPAAGDATTSATLWSEHQARILNRLGRLRVPAPRPQIERWDPFAVRVIAALVIYVGAFAGYGSYGERLGEAFRFSRAAAENGLRIDAWVTPPAYTGHPPIFLTGRAGGETGRDRPIRIPQGSIAVVRAQGVENLEVAHVTDAGERQIAALDAAEVVPVRAGGVEPAKAPRFTTHEIKLDEDGSVELAAAGKPVSGWSFEIVRDIVPSIAFRGPPEAQLSGAVKLSYTMEDDYAVIGAVARLAARDDSITFAPDQAETRPLVAAPSVKLALPQRRTKAGSSQTIRDLTSHPWAGGMVDVTLVARDEAGQMGQSEVIAFRLPARNFSKPMARAIVEQRRNLALDANRRLQVLDAFDALMIAPERFIDDASIYLGMRYVYRRLHQAEDDKALIEALDVMWDLALAIEDGDLSLAERALREAEEALRRALENGASEEEIKRLTQDLRDALNEYFKALAEQMMRNPGQQMPMDPNAQTLRQQDLQDMLDRIEDLARTGAHDAARELLSQMQQMLENLRAGRQQQMQQGRSASEMSDVLNKLAEMIQRQRELMDQSFQLDQDTRRQGRDGQPQRPGEDDGQAGSLGEQLAEALRQLQQGQGDLQQALKDLLNRLERDGVRGNEALGDAGRAMGRAKDALGEGEPGQAVGPQGDALQALRQGTQSLMQQMINQGQGQGMADGRGNPQRNQDPMGRPYRNNGTDDLGDSVKVPGEIDTQRARDILRELRRKLGDPLRSELERNYFERLLTPF